MNMVKSLLALIGALALLAGGAGYAKYKSFFGTLDPEAPRVFTEMYEKFQVNKETGQRKERDVVQYGYYACEPVA